MEFAFELDRTITNQINFLDNVLSELEVGKIYENPDFLIDRESAGTFFLQIQVMSEKKNTVPMHIFLQGSSLRIDIDGIPETFEWTNKDIEKPKAYVIRFIKQLFTSYILLEYCRSYTDMYLFDITGRLIYKTTLRYYGFLGSLFKRDCQKKLFLPVYP